MTRKVENRNIWKWLPIERMDINLEYMPIDKKELYQRCSFTISMKTDLEEFFFFAE